MTAIYTTVSINLCRLFFLLPTSARTARRTPTAVSWSWSWSRLDGDLRAVLRRLGVCGSCLVAGHPASHAHAHAQALHAMRSHDPRRQQIPHRARPPAALNPSAEGLAPHETPTNARLPRQAMQRCNAACMQQHALHFADHRPNLSIQSPHVCSISLTSSSVSTN
jgi:hypothetical protein